MKKIFLMLCTITMFSVEAEAQFLKDLKKKVEDRTKDVVEYKVAEKAGQTTENAMDKILNPNFKGLGAGGKMGKSVDTSTLPDSYSFQYLYALKINNSEGDITINYYLNESESYMGIKMDVGMDFFMVMDDENKVMVNFINNQAIATSLDIGLEDEMDEDGSDEMNFDDYTITELPNREFLGYDCIGRQMESEEYTFIMYMAMDMPVTLNNEVFKSGPNTLPAELRSLQSDYENGLMMYMEFIDKKNTKKKKNTSGIMECVAYEPVALQVNVR